MPITLDYSDDMHCAHGLRVGGMGPDYMCGRCELDEGPDIVPEIYPWEQWTLNDRRVQYVDHCLTTIRWAFETIADHNIPPLPADARIGDFIRVANQAATER